MRGFFGMVPRLKAEEALEMIHVLNVGGGHLDAKDYHKAIRRLQVMAEMDREVLKPQPHDLAAMGIVIEKQKQ